MPGPQQLMIILLVLVLLFGAKKLPELAKSLGKSSTAFKAGKDEGMREMEEASKALDGSDDSVTQANEHAKSHEA